MIETDKRTGRAIVIGVVTATTTFVLLVVSFNYAMSVTAYDASGLDGSIPLLTEWHHGLHARSWWLVAFLAVWGGILVFRPPRSPIVLIVYVGALVSLATAWFLLTLLAFYLAFTPYAA